jgi:Mn-dependent DtxR family transcriptional regulator
MKFKPSVKAIAEKLGMTPPSVSTSAKRGEMIA